MARRPPSHAESYYHGVRTMEGHNNGESDRQEHGKLDASSPKVGDSVWGHLAYVRIGGRRRPPAGAHEF